MCFTVLYKYFIVVVAIVLYIYIPLICMWVFVHCMFFSDYVVTRFESLKALYKFPIIIIMIM